MEKPHELTVLTNTNALKLNSSYISQAQGNRIKDTVFMMLQKNAMLIYFHIAFNEALQGFRECNNLNFDVFFPRTLKD